MSCIQAEAAFDAKDYERAASFYAKVLEFDTLSPLTWAMPFTKDSDSFLNCYRSMASFLFSYEIYRSVSSYTADRNCGDV